MNKKKTHTKKLTKKVNTKVPVKSTAASRVKKTNTKTNKTTNNKHFVSIISLGVAILLFLCIIIPGKNIWCFLHKLLFGLFSKGAYFLPLIFLYISYIYATGKLVNSFKSVLNKSIFLFVLICTLAQILFSSNIEPKEGIINFIITAFNNGVDKIGGGLFSAIIAWPLLKLLGFGGAVALISVSIFIIIMVISKTTLIDLFKAAYVPAKKIENIYSERRHTSHKTNIDIPLDDLPAHPVESNKNSFYNSIDLPVADQNETFKFVELDNIKNTNVDLPNSHQNTNDSPITDLNITKNDLPKTKTVKQTETTSKNLSEDIDKLFKEKINKDNVASSDVKLTPNATPAIATNSNNLKITSKQQNIDSYVFPSVDLLNNTDEKENPINLDELKVTAQKLVDTLKSFGVSTKLLDFSKGPTVTRYELQPSAGVKISKITGLADDIALNLAAAGVRIEAPIPNKAAIGIEIPNQTVSIVNIKEIINSPQFKSSTSNLTVALGRDISGQIVIADLSKMPHILIAGSTGSGKSVCINSIIISLIFKSSPENVKLLMIDPKVVELSVYNSIPHLLVPVVTDPKKAAGSLNWAVNEMLKRYKIFAEMGVRDLNGYNKLTQKRDDLNPLPQIVIIIDELADLMMAAPNEIEDSICRLAQMARAAGMYLVIATQRPSVDVITGIIKANIPSRIAFAVSSQVDSRTIIDSAGAEKLLGRGDMLFYPVGHSKPIRVQGCFVSDREVENVVEFIKSSHQADYDDEISQEIDRLAVVEKNKGLKNLTASNSEEDEMLPKAIECAIENGEISTSFLQRKLKLGYSRAARLVDEMESKGIVGPKEGSKARQTLISRQQWIEMNLNNSD